MRHDVTPEWTRRAAERRLPASDRTGTIATARDSAIVSGERVTISGRSWTVADLQRAVAREDR